MFLGSSFDLCSSEMKRIWAVSRDAVPKPNDGLETYVERTWMPHVERLPMIGVTVPREGFDALFPSELIAAEL